MDERDRVFYRDWDGKLLALILLLINIPLFFHGNTDRWAFYPLLAHSQWWRAITGPFAHITWFHLLLDGIPFLLLYAALEEDNPWRRLFTVVLAGVGSTLAAIWFSAAIQKHGLRGLSGITYGIVAVTALEMISQTEKKKIRVMGTLILVALFLMIGYELVTGKFPFGFLLFNMVGIPILVCHAGGVIGAIVAYALLHLFCSSPAAEPAVQPAAAPPPPSPEPTSPAAGQNK